MDIPPLIPTPCTTPILTPRNPIRTSTSNSWDYFVSGIVYKQNTQIPFSKTLTFRDGPRSYQDIIKIAKAPFILQARMHGSIKVIVTYVTHQQL